MINTVFKIGTLMQAADALGLLYSLLRNRPMHVILCISIFFAGELHAQVVKTRWKAVVDNPSSSDSRGRFELYTTNANGAETLVNSDFPVKGIDFSTIRINEDPNSMRWMSDVYWDNVTYDPFSAAPDNATQNYKFLWRDGQCMSDQSITCRGDLAKIKSLNANMIRIYGLTSRLKPVGPEPSYTPYIPAIQDMDNPDLVARVTHKEFLDECAKNGLHVMVGLYFNDAYWDKNLWDQQSTNEALKNEVIWYDKIYKEVVQEVGSHPAVMGFCISNEVDNPDRIYKNQTMADFFWKQVDNISSVIRGYAPGKLCGMAFTDKLIYNKMASYYMSRSPFIDYWGVNCYRADENQMDNLFFENSEVGLGFSNLAPQAKKPVLLTEFGFSQTSRTINDGSCEGVRSITDLNETITRRVAWLTSSLGGLFIQPPATRRYKMCPGMFYFEFSDEWYKPRQMEGRPCVANPASEWIGAYEPTPSWPNGSGWLDESAFGIFSIAKAEGLANSDPTTVNWSGPGWSYFGPDPRYDRLMLGTNGTSRKYLFEEIRDLYSVIPQSASLLASYKFNGNANDDSEYKRNGTVFGAPAGTTDRFGFPNSAYHFNGNDGITIPYPYLGSSFTFTAWVLPDIGNNNERGIVGSTNAYLSMKNGNQYVATRSVKYSGTGTSWGPNNAELQEWAHLALVSDGTTLKLYIDGELQNTYSGNMNTASQELNIGKLTVPLGGFYGWKGKIDDVSIYRGTLTGTEIAALSADRPVIRYSFNIDANLKARDESGNDLDADILWGPVATSDRFGTQNSAYIFDGDNDQIRQNSLPALGLEYSITTWVYYDNELADRREIISGGSSTDNNGYYLYKTSDDYRADLSNAQGPAGPAPGFYSGVGRWIHLGVVVRGSAVELYVNGLSRGTRPMSPDISAGPLSIGKVYFPYTGSASWKGKIDDVTVHRRALLPEEMVKLASDRLIAVPVASYKFDGNAKDNSGADLHGTVTGATLTTDRFGFPNSAYQFDGDDVITANLPAIGSAYSVSAWVLADDSNTGRCEIISGGSENHSNGYFLFRSSNQYHTDLSYVQGPVGTAGAEPSEWKHLAAVSDGATLKLYVDGVLQNTIAASANIVAGPLSIGKVFFSYSGSSNWKGKIDDVTIYKGVLSADDIAAMSSDRPVVRYVFNNNYIDESGNNRHASLSGVSSTSDRFGVTNRSYSFDGYNDIITCNTMPALGKEYSITTWVYSNDTNTARREIISGGGSYTASGYSLYRSSDQYHTDLTNILGPVGTSGMKTGKWVHLGVTARISTVELYVDGVLQESRQMSPDITVSPLSIGGKPYDLGIKYWLGNIDDVTVHKKPLSGKEMVKLASDRPGGSAARSATSEESVTNVEEVEVSKALTFYPNPTKGEVRLSFKTGSVSDLNIQVLDLTGSILANEKIAIKGSEQGIAVINLKDDYGLNPGVYLIRFVGDNKYLGTKRIVLE